MSGGIAQLVAVGAQDAHLVGDPEVSFFRSTYRRHTNFSQTVERQVIQGALSQGGMSTVRFERKGDLLGYTYFTSINNASNACEALDWSTMIDKVELLVGGQVIDDQDAFFTNNIAPNLFATGIAKSVAGELYRWLHCCQVSTPFGSLSVRTGSLPSLSWLFSTMTSSSGSGGSRMSTLTARSVVSSVTLTTSTWTPMSVNSSPVTPVRS